MARNRSFFLILVCFGGSLLGVQLHFGQLSLMMDSTDYSPDLGRTIALSTRSHSLTFRDIIIDQIKGKGSVSLVFKVRIPKLDTSKEYIMKVAADDNLRYHTIEAQAFSLLNKPPLTSSSIPPLILQVPSMKNPWTKRDIRKLGIGRWKYRTAKRISIQVFPCVPHTGLPTHDNLPELARFMRSLLAALDFAHSRKVMNCDIDPTNIAYDKKTGTAYLFDWNGARIFGPKVALHQKGENKRIVPPEGRKSDHAMHATVSAFDIYGTGVVLNRLLCEKTVCKLTDRNKNEQLWQAHDLAALMMTEDPYKRPAAAELLKHDFVKI